MNYAIAVIDIGMTNKKVTVYDEHLEQIDVTYKEFSPLLLKDPATGLEMKIHDLQSMESWFIEQLRIYAEKYPVRAISVTTHGATFVCIDENGSVCAPCIFYTYDPGRQFQNSFYELCGTKENLQRQTFTPPFSAMLNLAKGIWFLQIRFPGYFSKTAAILGFPQYWSFRLTGRMAYEATYQACHTYLWNMTANTWSPVVDRLGIRSKMPPVFNPTCRVLGTLTPEAAAKLGLDTSVIVTTGIHDSNASLLPYLAKNAKEDFILNSTGTWCVCMHPKEQAVFDDEDIGKIVFFNRSAVDKPVKTAVFPGGMEIDTYVKLYQRECRTETFPASGITAAQSLISERNVFIVPEVIPGSGQFPESKPGIFENGIFYPLDDMQKGISMPEILSDRSRFFAALDLSLVIQTETALRRAGLKNGIKVFTEGGFRRNKLYTMLLSSVLKENEIYLTNMKEATSTGCAMTALMALTGKTHTELAPLLTIEKESVPKTDLSGFDEYKADWIMHTKK